LSKLSFSGREATSRVHAAVRIGMSLLGIGPAQKVASPVDGAWRCRGSTF